MELSKLEKEKIAEENMLLVYYVVTKMFQNTGIPNDELISIAFVGYAKALNKFNTDRDVKFSTYAINCIRNEILFFLRKEKKHMKNNISLNTSLSFDKNGNELTLEEIIADGNSDTKSLDDMIIEDEYNSFLNKALDKLTEKERYIIVYRYGLDRGIIKTQKEIADNIGMSQANVSKIQKNALDKIKDVLEINSLF